MMTWKELMKEIYKVKGYHTESLETMIDCGGVNIVLTKDELEELASQLILKDDDTITQNYYTNLD
ncbi:hypothetical protein ACF3NG_06850 [Aerococcaceae bacterium WGS1372]